jgi:hypothetical protein
VFLGHFAVAFAAKRVAPELSLGTLFLSAQLADLLWPDFLLLHAEHVEIAPGITAVTPLDFVSYPYSHSLVALCVWGALLAGVWWAVRRGRAVAALVLFGGVLSHWLLDVVSHRPDMPVTLTGPTRLGLGLWRSVPATVVVEGALFVAGVALYARTTAPRDRAGPGGDATGEILPLARAFVRKGIHHVARPPPGPARALRPV